MTYSLQAPGQENPTLKLKHRDHINAMRQWTKNRITGHRRWQLPTRYFRRSALNYLRFLIPKNQRVLALGCSTGDTLANHKPAFGMGVDLDPYSFVHIRSPDIRYQDFLQTFADSQSASAREQLTEKIPYRSEGLFDD